jgi:hypothetical protein
VIASYHMAVLNLPVAVAIVVIYANPALVVLWSAVSSQHLPRPEVVGALVVAMLGVALVSGLASGDFEGLRWIGLALALATAILFASFTLLAEGAATSYGPLRAIALGFVVASILCLLYQAPLGWPDTLFRRSSLPLTAFVAVFGGLLPFPLYGWGGPRRERGACGDRRHPAAAGCRVRSLDRAGPDTHRNADHRCRARGAVRRLASDWKPSPEEVPRRSLCIVGPLARPARAGEFRCLNRPTECWRRRAAACWFLRS